MERFLEENWKPRYLNYRGVIEVGERTISLGISWSEMPLITWHLDFVRHVVNVCSFKVFTLKMVLSHGLSCSRDVGS